MKTLYKTNRFCAEERETHLWYDPIDRIWRLESNIPKHFNKAVRQGWTVESQTLYDDGTVCAMTFTAPDGAVTFRNPNKKREMTDAQKAALFGSKKCELDEDFLDE